MIGDAPETSTTRHARRWLMGLSAAALGLSLITVIEVAGRVTFPYDVITWADDYVLNELIKLRLGAALYGPYSDANSYIYAPGGVLLHRLLLAPWGLDLSLVANRVLAQLWLALAVVLGVRLIAMISAGQFRRRVDSIVGAVGAASALTLAGYSNSMADSLHPATLELLVLTLAATVAARWSGLSLGARICAALVVPACGLLVKQTGVSIGLALASVALLTPVGSGRQRIACAAASLASPVLTFIGLEVATDGAFARWGLLLPLRQPVIWHHTAYLVACAAAIAPLLVLLAVGVGRVLEQRTVPAYAAWLRVATLPLFYLPLTLPAFLKVGGGAFDFGALSFLCALLALAQIRNLLTGVERGLPQAVVGLIAALQLLLWAPYRRVPTEADRVAAARLCAHVVEALQCGERVLLDLGASCLVEGGVKHVPRDRLFTMMELKWAGLGSATGTAQRIAAEEYDLLAFRAFLPPWPWPPAMISALAEHYVGYATLPAASPPPMVEFDLVDKTRFDDWQGLDQAVYLFERKRDAGRHREKIQGPPQCDRRRPTTPRLP